MSRKPPLPPPDHAYLLTAWAINQGGSLCYERDDRRTMRRDIHRFLDTRIHHRGYGTSIYNVAIDNALGRLTLLDGIAQNRYDAVLDLPGIKITEHLTHLADNLTRRACFVEVPVEISESAAEAMIDRPASDLVESGPTLKSLLSQAIIGQITRISGLTHVNIHSINGD